MRFFEGYRLYGYLNLFPGLAGFVYPIFVREETYYFADGNCQYIERFVPVKSSYTEQVCRFPISGEKEYAVGGRQIFLYMKEDGQVILGSGKRLYGKLCSYKVGNEWLQRELEDFLINFETEGTTFRQRYYATGRRKTAVARVYLMPGSGRILINNRAGEELFAAIWYRNMIQQPFAATGTVGKYDVTARVKGGGSSGQAGAICLGIARALLKVDAGYRKPLKMRGLLTRDPRMKERKKPGRKAARKAAQSSKR